MLMNMGEHNKQIKPAYQLEADKLLKQLGSNIHGLSEAESAMRLQQYGRNDLGKIKKDPTWLKFVRQFKDLLIILLIINVVISLVLKDYQTAIIIASLVVVNALIGFWQEFKAENIMASLSNLVVPKARVRRGGEVEEIPTSELVPGDIIHISEGDSVPADARVLKENTLSTNDFALTGESNPSRKFTHKLDKHIGLARRHNLVFMGTTVATGDALCVVVSTGLQTELGRIAGLSQQTEQDLSPLQKEINYTATVITKATLALACILLAIALIQDFGIKNALLFAIGISTAMIPNGLPAAINVTLTGAASKLAVAKALAKRLSAVETLGATSMILTDKTGTLTKNQMTVQQIYSHQKSYWVEGLGYEPKGKLLTADKKAVTTEEIKQLELLFLASIFASNAKVRAPDEDHKEWYILGDPTEGALVVLAEKCGHNSDELDEKYEEIKEFTFDSVRKMMSSVRDYQGLKVFAKGAPESILKNCTHILVNGHEKPITKDDVKHILAKSEMMAGAAMRNLALAYKKLPGSANVQSLDMKTAEKDLVFVGMVSMIDPPREEVAQAMEAARRAHIPISIITGDNSTTASAIAIKTGLASSLSELKLVAGNELGDMEDDQIIHLISRGQAVFSRVAPEDKLRIVELGKKSGHVVAVTGDGINDAPALKRADIGVAMGITGTDVAKESADIVLLDDSFSSLVTAIGQGRVIFQNIKKIVLSVLTGNASELTVILISLAAFGIWGIPIAITVILILAIDLVAELFPVAALGWDEADNEVMDNQPRKLSEHIITKAPIIDIALSGLVNGALAYGLFYLFIVKSGEQPASLSTSSDIYASAITLTYITVCFCMFANILARRAPSYRQALFSSYLFSNSQLWLAFGMSLTAMAIIAYVPFVQDLLGSGPLKPIDWALAFGAGLIYLVIRWLFIARIRLG